MLVLRENRHFSNTLSKTHTNTNTDASCNEFLKGRDIEKTAWRIPVETIPLGSLGTITWKALQASLLRACLLLSIKLLCIWDFLKIIFYTAYKCTPTFTSLNNVSNIIYYYTMNTSLMYNFFLNKLKFAQTLRKKKKVIFINV